MISKNPVHNALYLTIFLVFSTILVFKVLLVNPAGWEYVAIPVYYAALIGMILQQLWKAKKEK
ncbi:hypothetical protein [Thalassobacillus sp. B23F22_16]|uniref:hypothetical protein n=1 Tax=Thalassobacillus sp. B23F22_16 TaxID=3459513 RepID=UPI00373E47D8